MTLRAPRYMTRFRCIGSDCRDTCCREGWGIRVDRQHYEKLQARMSSPEEKAALDAGMKKSGDPDPRFHALLVLDDAGCCRFLSKDSLCTLHARYGEELIPDDCSRYPRIIGRLGVDFEIYGSPSCPEVVTQMLASDESMDLIAAEPESFGRGLVSYVVDADSSVYQRTYPAVRDTALWLLGQRRFPIASRLFFVAWFGEKTRKYLRRDMPPGHADELRTLMRALQGIGSLAQLEQQYAELTVGTSFGVTVARELLCLPAHFHSTVLNGLRAEADAILAPRGARLDRDEDTAALDRAYRSLPPLAPEHEARLAAAIERYAENQVLIDWFPKQSSFFGWVFLLLARVAAVRFLVRTLATAPQEKGFDDLLVRVIYSFSRLLEHNDALPVRLLEDLEKQGLVSLEYAASLTRV